MVLPSPAQAAYFSLPGQMLFAILYLVGTALFVWILAKRLIPILQAQRDPRFDRPLLRLRMVARYWLGQWKHPRYPAAGIIHLLIFAGFVLLIIHALSLLAIGVVPGMQVPGGRVYGVVTDYAATVVFVAVLAAGMRRLLFRPERYSVPLRYGKPRGPDAIFLLALIALVMLASAICE